nr:MULTISPECIES: substrate-binding domain-containing protein [unclassified Butyricicoccus]
MKKRLLAVLMSSAMLMSALAGCGGSTAKTNNGGDTADQTTQQDYHIKVILKTLASEYWQYVGNGCKQAGKDLGVTVDVLGASSETAYDEQLSMIETTLSANDCDAMVVAPLQAETVATQIANTDLPIVAIDTAIDSDKVLSFVGFNNEELAAMGGKAAVEAAKDKAGIRLPPSASWVCRATPPRRHALQALSRALQKLAASISLRKRSTQTA